MADTADFCCCLYDSDFRSNAYRRSHIEAYSGHEAKIGGLIDVDYGVRFSALQNTGDDMELVFDKDYNVIDSITHDGGIYNTYCGMEPRLSVNWRLTDQSSLKVNYQKTYQYVQRNIRKRSFR